jgi:hypothetical protein
MSIFFSRRTSNVSAGSKNSFIDIVRRVTTVSLRKEKA